MLKEYFTRLWKIIKKCFDLIFFFLILLLIAPFIPKKILSIFNSYDVDYDKADKYINS